MLYITNNCPGYFLISRNYQDFGNKNSLTRTPFFLPFITVSIPNQPLENKGVKTFRTQ